MKYSELMAVAMIAGLSAQFDCEPPPRNNNLCYNPKPKQPHERKQGNKEKMRRIKARGER